MRDRILGLDALVIIGLITTLTVHAIFQPKLSQHAIGKAQGFLSFATPRNGPSSIASDLTFLPRRPVTLGADRIHPFCAYNEHGVQDGEFSPSIDGSIGAIALESEPAISADGTTATIATDGRVDGQIQGHLAESNPFVRARGRVRRIYPHPITFDDIVKHRMIPQPPSRKHDQRVIARRPFKRLGIPERIQLEKKRIEAVDHFLDNYFAHVTRKCGLTKYVNMFPEPTLPMTDCIFDFGELLQILDIHGIYFYMSLHKAVAVADIMAILAHRYSRYKPDHFKRNNYADNRSLRQLIGAIRRHVLIADKVNIPKHLVNHDEMFPHVPKVTDDELLAVANFQRAFQLEDPRLKEWTINMFQQRVDHLAAAQITHMIFRLHDVISDRKDILAQCTRRLKEDLSAFLSLDTKIICTTIKKLHQCYFHDVELLEMCADYFLQGDKITFANAFGLFDMFASTDYLNEPLYKKIYAVLTENAKMLPWDVKCISLLIDDINYCHIGPPKELADELSRMLVAKVHKLSMVNFTVAVRNLARSGYYNPELIQLYFNIPIIKDAPSLQQSMHFVRRLKAGRSYEVYEQLSRNEFLGIISMAYETYLAYQLECESSPKFTLSSETVKNLRDCYIYWDQTTPENFYAHLLEMKQLLYEEFKIVSEPFFYDPSGLRVDLAILPQGLSEIIDNVDFIRGKQFGFVHRGPHHYIQGCLKEGTPPLRNRRLLHKRLLAKLGWQIADVPYWQYVSWMSRKAKVEFLYSLLPEWLQQLVKKPA